MKRITSARYSSKGLKVFLFALCFSVLSHAQTTVTLLEGSFVEYEAKDERETVFGRAPIETLELSLDLDNLSRSKLRVVIDPAKFDSGNGIRDTNARRTVFESKEFPEIVFELEAITSTADALADSESVTVNLEGTLTMHGLSRDLSLDATVSRTDTKVTAEGEFEVSLTAFEMSRPSFLIWTIEDTVVIRFNILGSL